MAAQESSSHCPYSCGETRSPLNPIERDGDCRREYLNAREYLTVSNTPMKEAKDEPIGYFYFLDGGFRWDSLISFPKIKISNAKIVPAKLIKKAEPVYPADAAAQHIFGTVRVYYVIGGDGAVYNAHALSGEGLSEDPSLRKAAEDAVLQWRYQPATMDGKPIQTNAVTVDLKFSPKS